MSRASCAESSAAVNWCLAARYVRSDFTFTSDQLNDARRSVYPNGPIIVGNPGNPQAFRRQVHLRNGFVRVELDIGQQRLQLAQSLRPRRGRLGPAQNRSQVVLKAPLDCIVQRQIQRLTGRVACRDTSLKAAARSVLHSAPEFEPESAVQSHSAPLWPPPTGPTPHRHKNVLGTSYSRLRTSIVF